MSGNDSGSTQPKPQGGRPSSTKADAHDGFLTRGPAGFLHTAAELYQKLVVHFTWLISVSTARTALITAAIFVFDWLTPLGVSGGVLYMAAVLSAVPIRHRWAIWITASVCSVLVLLGWTVSPGRGETEIWKVLLNRTLGLGVIWACAALAESWNRLQRRRTRQLQESRLLHQATALSASDVSFQEALQNSVTVLCDILGWPAGHVYVREAGGHHLVSADTWHLPDDGRFELLQSTASGVRFARGEGVPGRIWETGQPIAVPDVAQSSDYAWLKEPERLGVKGAFAFPLTVGQRVAAVVEFFSEHEIAEDPEFTRLACNIGQQIGRLFERRRAEQALRESEERLRLALAGGHMGTWEWQVDTGRIIWSPELQRLHGMKPGTFGQTLEAYQECIHPDDRQRVIDEIRQSIETGQDFHAEYRMLRPDGDVRWFEGRGALHAASESRGQRMVGVCMDITQRKQVEVETRRAKDAAEAVNRLRSRFLANVSHELRTPMNAILGMLQLALQDDQLDPQLDDYLRTAKNSADSLLVLLNDLLDFSRLEADRLRIQSEPFQLREVLDQSIKPLSAKAFEKHLELICHVEADVPDRLIGDADRLRQVITNLVNNATKFTNQGEIVLRVALEQKLPREARIRFSISDTGVGIPAEDHQRIFEPFTQSEMPANRESGGVGLGLAICRELVRRMGGRLCVESESGEGSRFWFSLALPLASEDTREAEYSIHLEALHGLPVLVVDDNETNRLLLVDILQRWAMRPEAAIDGDHALGKLHRAISEQRSYSLVIADGWMPGMDGLELAQRTAEDFDPPPPLVLMLSAADRQVCQEEKADTPVAAYLEKPVSPSKLLDSVMTALDVQPPRATDESSRWAAGPPMRSLAVLLVEDTPANQKVVSSILQRRGHNVTIANDGRAGIDIFQRQPFDVVLMDVQMPLMNGYEATEEIRRLEQDGAAKTPIIAMTAHAMEGDRERCLAAGMDSYLAKPIDVKRLVDVVESLAAARSVDTSVTGPVESRAADAGQDGFYANVLDFAEALNRLAGDEALYLEFIQAFHDDSPGLLEGIHTAIADGDADLLERYAHSLKGLAANLGATAVTSVAADLEYRGASRQLNNSGESLTRLNEEMSQLVRALYAYRERTNR